VIKDWLQRANAGSRKTGFVALMIDHGFIFNGPNWNFVESAFQGLYARRMVYSDLRTIEDLEPWMNRVRHFPDTVLDCALRRILRSGSRAKRRNSNGCSKPSFAARRGLAS
jgi:hypothetical protein